ncbi:MAG: ATP-binding cassette domain-containing protein [Anaerolineaceae bacterium]|nr:ATP-binding cassette domain-containing protein [Anaerolineaceae bacterium]
MAAEYTSLNGKKPLIQLKGIEKTYVNAAGSFTALKHIYLDFYQGEFVGVIGKSGSGKSTLVNMITGIDRPTEGQVLVEKVDIHAMQESKQARWRGLNLGVVFQFFQLLPMLTLVENVLLPMDFCNKYTEAEREARAMDLLAMMGLEKDAHKLPGAVSGGQQQSAAIARALANDPPIIVADEPTGNLDARTADFVYDKFQSLANEGRTIIMITHDPEIEHRLSRTVLISDGVVIDPLLAHTFHWMPHSVLRICTDSLQRQTLDRRQSLTLNGTLANALILVEKGRLWARPDGPSETLLTFKPGDILPGPQLSNNHLPQLSEAYAADDSTEVAILPYPAFLQASESYPEVRTQFQQRLAAQIEAQLQNESGVTR